MIYGEAATEKQPMRATYDAAANAAYIYFVEPVAGAAKRTVKASEGMFLDYDAEGRLLGIEILEARERLPESMIREAEQLGPPVTIGELTD